MGNVHDKMADGNTASEKICGVIFDGPLIPFAAEVSCKPISFKDEARPHQFGKNTTCHDLARRKAQTFKAAAFRSSMSPGAAADLLACWGSHRSVVLLAAREARRYFDHVCLHRTMEHWGQSGSHAGELNSGRSFALRSCERCTHATTPSCPRPFAPLV